MRTPSDAETHWSPPGNDWSIIPTRTCIKDRDVHLWTTVSMTESYTMHWLESLCEYQYQRYRSTSCIVIAFFSWSLFPAIFGHVTSTHLLQDTCSLSDDSFRGNTDVYIHFVGLTFWGWLQIKNWPLIFLLEVNPVRLFWRRKKCWGIWRSYCNWCCLQSKTKVMLERIVREFLSY